MKNIISILSEFLSVKKCYGCQKPGHFFCPRCIDMLEFHPPHCCVCKKYSENFITHQACQKYTPLQQVVILTHYKTGVKKLLRHGKYYNKYQAYESLITPHTDFLKEYISGKNMVLIPVPVHFFRRWGRGYNQAEKITQYISDSLSLRRDYTLISRKRYTKHQNRLSRLMRFKNLQNSFKVKNNSYSQDTTFYIVDDITTTGSTLDEIGRVLQISGFTDIRAVVLASD